MPKLNFNYRNFGLIVNVLIINFIFIPFIWIEAAAIPGIPVRKFDVFVFGSGISGISAAISAARMGMQVGIMEQKIPHLKSFGSGIDTGNVGIRKIASGFSKEFADSVFAFYKERYGSDSDESKYCENGFRFDPKIGEKVLTNFLKMLPNIHVINGFELDSVPLKEGRKHNLPRSIVAFKTKNSKRKLRIEATIFIDASKSGTLAKLVGCRFRNGGSATSEFDEQNSEPIRNTECEQLVGQHLFTAHDIAKPRTEGRPDIHETTIGIGFNRNAPDKPFTIPFGIMISLGIHNVLVTNKISATCIGSKFLQYEISSAALGEVAGIAAAVSVKTKLKIKDIPIEDIQHQLIDRKIPLVYISDLSSGDPDFELIQNMAILGWFPEYEVQRDRKFSNDDLTWLAEKTMFSEEELRQITNAQNRLQGMKLIWNAWLDAGKKP